MVSLIIVVISLAIVSLALFSTHAAPFKSSLVSEQAFGSASDLALMEDKIGNVPVDPAIHASVPRQLLMSTAEVQAATTWYLADLYATCTSTCNAKSSACSSAALKSIVTRQAFVNMVSVARHSSTNALIGNAATVCQQFGEGDGIPPYLFVDNTDCYHPTTVIQDVGDCDLASYYQRFCPCQTTASPTPAPTEQPSSYPSQAPTPPPSTLAPTGIPTVLPSAPPSAPPSVIPSAQPSASPTHGPSALPTAIPSSEPSAVPSAVPSVIPSVTPSADPSAVPSAVPSAQPSVIPSVTPSADPSAVPSAMPSAQPSVIPSVTPSTDPSAVPSAVPSALPNVIPSATPSAYPSGLPSAVPSSLLTAEPTFAPSAFPSARPTIPAVKNYKLSVHVLQEIFSLTKAGYDAQKAASNRTIQHTVSAALPGVPPESVTDIRVEDTVEAVAKVRSQAVTVGSVTISYTLNVYDAVFTVDKLRTQLVQATSNGIMDTNFRHYARRFNATSFSNGTFAAPLVTSAAEQSDASERLTGAAIALVVVGVLLGLAMLIALLLFYCCRQEVTPQVVSTHHRVVQEV